jgi:hypothetical protein
VVRREEREEETAKNDELARVLSVNAALERMSRTLDLILRNRKRVSSGN